ncbi:MAG: hypothetical protein A2Y40_02135 [Candidatus Margulisbacteria bacterium GWF2_35_9]|nr:MAG: hypothetical protein A2Y40_02135 [Candidatus Margulisbacteria bacterium GWF2_35_9]
MIGCMRVLPYGTQSISFSDKLKIFRSFGTGWLTCGPQVQEFEEAIARYVGVKHAIAVSNGTAALHLVHLAIGYGEEEVGITSPNTFLASSNSIIYAGGRPNFSDIDSASFNINIDTIDPNTKNLKTITPVHFAGLPINVKKLKEKFPNTIIIEDAAHALGSKFHDGEEWVKTGCCKYSLATIFSFHPVKHITTGEGGIITTNDDQLADMLRQLRSHGMIKPNGHPDPWYYEMTELGYNYRITDFQCALGLSQLKKLDSFIKRRRQIVSLYQSAFYNIDGISFASEEKWQFNSYHLFVLLIDFEKFGMLRSEFMNKLKEKGILTQVHYIPVYQQPYYKKHFPHNEADFPNMEEYYKKAISIPLYPKMNNSDVSRVIKEIKNTLKIS